MQKPLIESLVRPLKQDLVLYGVLGNKFMWKLVGAGTELSVTYDRQFGVVEYYMHDSLKCHFLYREIILMPIEVGDIIFQKPPTISKLRKMDEIDVEEHSGPLEVVEFSILEPHIGVVNMTNGETFKLYCRNVAHSRSYEGDRMEGIYPQDERELPIYF